MIGYVGGTSTGYETRDGGATWTPVAMGQAVNKIRFVKSPDGKPVVGYAIGVQVHKWDALPTMAPATAPPIVPSATKQ